MSGGNDTKLMVCPEVVAYGPAVTLKPGEPPSDAMNKLIFANLIHRPLRSIISVLAVAIEVIMILSIVGIFMGMLNDQKTAHERYWRRSDDAAKPCQHHERNQWRPYPGQIRRTSPKTAARDSSSSGYQ